MEVTATRPDGPVMKFALMREVGDGQFVRDDLPPGSFEWGRNTAGEIVTLNYVCPCGCQKVGSLPVRSGYGGDAWTWDGNEGEPTLTPSIYRNTRHPGNCGWHGFLTAGVFRSC